MLEMKTLFKGKVQGVGFRLTTEKFAKELNLTGFVRNLPNGDVELVAQGPKKELKRLVDKLTDHFARNVAAIKTSFHSVQQIFTSFQMF